MTDLHKRIADSFNAQGLMLTLGARLLHVEDGEVQIELPFSSHLSQQHGYVHAGATTSILDSACGYAALTKAAPDFEVVTAEFKINLLRPAVGQRFLAIGRVQNAGKLLSVCTGEVRAFSGPGDEHKVIAIMQSTIANVPRYRLARPLLRQPPRFNGRYVIVSRRFWTTYRAAWMSRLRSSARCAV